MSTKVTIIMATYNRAHLILETLASIQAQVFQDWECLIIDDDGTDNTFDTIRLVLEKDSRFQFFKRPNRYKKGLPGSRNYGLDLAKGDSIVFFDDDDVVHPQNLDLCVTALSDENIDFVHYQKQSFGSEVPQMKQQILAVKGKLSVADMEQIVTQEIGLASCTLLWKRKCFEGNRFNESLMYAEEWECYTRIISQGYSGLVINNVLYYNRKHRESNTGEFYAGNTVRAHSKAKAIMLMAQNLNESQLLSDAIKRYFVQLSIRFREYDVYDALLSVFKPTMLEKLKWHFFYFTLPGRLAVYRKWKGMKRHAMKSNGKHGNHSNYLQ